MEKIKTIGSTYMAATGLNATSGQDTQQVQHPFFANQPSPLIGGPIIGPYPDVLIDPAGGLAHCQDAERSCSHLGTMVEFAVALGSKLDVINKHSFNNFRLRVGEDPPLLGQSGTSSPPSQALPPPRSFVSYSPVHPWSPLQTHP